MGALIGSNYAFYQTDKNYVVNEYSLPGFNAAVFYRKQIFKYLSIETKLIYFYTRVENAFKANSFEKDAYVYTFAAASDYGNTHTLAIPLILQLRSSGKIIFFANFGTQISTSFRFDYRNNYQNQFSGSNSKSFSKLDYFLSLLAGVGTEIPVNDRLFIKAELRSTSPENLQLPFQYGSILTFMAGISYNF